MSRQYQANFDGETPDGVIRGASEAEPPSFLEIIAKTAHEVLRAYKEGHGDHSQPAWENATQAQRASTINGVTYFYHHPNATGEELHEHWKAQKVAEGWVYGEEKDSVRQTHPCIVPYNQLPFREKVKDYLFLMTVKSFVTSN